MNELVAELGQPATVTCFRGRLAAAFRSETGHRTQSGHVELQPVTPVRPGDGAVTFSRSHGSDRAVVLAMSGELDLAGAFSLDAHVREVLGGSDRLAELIVDCTALSFLSLSGVRALQAVDRQCRAAGVRLRVATGSQPSVLRALTLSGTANLLHCYRRRVDALAAPGTRPQA